MNKKIEMAKINTNNREKEEVYYIYKDFIDGQKSFSVYVKVNDDKNEYFCDRFYSYENALDYVLSFVK